MHFQEGNHHRKIWAPSIKKQLNKIGVKIAGNTDLLCITREYLYALADLLMTIQLTLSIRPPPPPPPKEPVHDLKQLHFEDLLYTFILRHDKLGVTPQNLSCAPKSQNNQFCPHVPNNSVGRKSYITQLSRKRVNIIITTSMKGLA